MACDIQTLRTTADRLRYEVVRMISRAKSCHIGSCLSVMDILVALYGKHMRYGPSTQQEQRDRFVLSKGHAAAALYAVLSEYGFFPKQKLDEYLVDGSPFIAHTNAHGVPGVEFSTGSLGHGLPFANGLALAGKLRSAPYRVFAVLSEGDCEEGSTWEAALFASHRRLSNLVVVIDHNKIQNYGRVEDVAGLAPLEEKWKAFGWGTRVIDGHVMQEIIDALHGAPFTPDRPTAIIANTLKGKGVSFMEDQLKWHYQTPSPEEVEAARKELLPDEKVL